ncbi:MAG: 6-carboxytetrahydropterin synthase QueD [Candidatus Coatesbacteria bacterium]|nr:6-carboxytetrahydropterin synthase QueD [Candidatus Coatesbacteria bacterium]
MYELTVKSSFAAAHRLRNYGGKCENIHGHNWVVEMSVTSESLNSAGLAIDFKDLKTALESALQLLDHRMLNEVAPFDEINPSSENIARWLYEDLAERLREYSVLMSRVTIWENRDCCAAYWE